MSPIFKSKQSLVLILVLISFSIVIFSLKGPKEKIKDVTSASVSSTKCTHQSELQKGEETTEAKAKIFSCSIKEKHHSPKVIKPKLEKSKKKKLKVPEKKINLGKSSKTIDENFKSFINQSLVDNHFILNSHEKFQDSQFDHWEESSFYVIKVKGFITESETLYLEEKKHPGNKDKNYSLEWKYDIEESFILQENNGISGWIKVKTQQRQWSDIKSREEAQYFLGGAQKIYLSGIINTDGSFEIEPIKGKEINESVENSKYLKENPSFKILGKWGDVIDFDKKENFYSILNTERSCRSNLMVEKEKKLKVKINPQRRSIFRGKGGGRILSQLGCGPLQVITVEEIYLELYKGGGKGWMILNAPGYFKGKQFFKLERNSKVSMIASWEEFVTLKGEGMEYLHLSKLFQNYLRQLNEERPKDIFQSSTLWVENHILLDSLSFYEENLSIHGLSSTNPLSYNLFQSGFKSEGSCQPYNKFILAKKFKKI